MPQDITNNPLTLSNQDALKKSLEYNKYTFGDGVDTYLQFDPINRYNSSEGSYKDYINNLKAQTDDLDMGGTILNGQGIGWDGDNLTSNFDIRNTIAGRALTATGQIDDTPLGMIGNKALKDILINRTLFNTQRETVGKINIDPINAIKGGDIIRPNYSITVGYGFFGKLRKTFRDVTGIRSSIDLLSDKSSIWESGNSQNMIKNTGRGQVRALFTHLKENKWGPGYDVRGMKKLSLDGQRSYQDLINDLGGFSGLVDNEVNYGDVSAPEGSLLAKTKDIVNGFNPNTGELLPIKRGHWLMHEETEIMVNPSEIMNTVQKGGQHFISRGSQVKTKDGDKIFARVFTKDNPYKKVKDLQKNKGLAYTDSADKSVLDSNGFVRISPYQSDNISESSNAPRDGNMKKFMLSIENLAWDGYENDLPASEVGPGDKVNGTRGRIMWFPPYDITFNDTTSVNIESTNFIGRGEPVYTYNNSERTGTLQFKIIIDYPSYIEDFKGETEEFFQRVAAGVENISYANVSTNAREQIETANVIKPQMIIDNAQTPPSAFTVYFDESKSDVDTTLPKNKKLTNEFAVGTALKLNHECPDCTIQLKVHIADGEDEALLKEREESVSAWLKSVGIDNPIKLYGQGISTSSVVVKFVYDPTKNASNLNQIKPMDTSARQNRTLTTATKKKFMNESMYFKKLNDESPLAFDTIKDKIEYFHPAFHSITPEGFNSRLTFLQQCTRQGPTQNEDKASNLAFGKPPVCILRIGDFYHTKMMMDNLSFTYDPLVWDLNPEGVGVQPMICTVDISFKFIGGSSLDGPINKLQNAISYNFFANSEVYDDRADRIQNGKFQEGRKINKNDVSAEEVSTGSVEVETPPVDETKRVENEVIEKKVVKSVSADDIMQNLVVSINGVSSSTVSFVISKKPGADINIEKPIKVKVKSQIINVFDKENTKAEISYKEYELAVLTLDNDTIGVEQMITPHEDQKNGFLNDNTLSLIIDHKNMKITETITI